MGPLTHARLGGLVGVITPIPKLEQVYAQIGLVGQASEGYGKFGTNMHTFYILFFFNITDLIHIILNL